MCFSIQVEHRLGRIAEIFEALNSKKDFENYSHMKALYPQEYRGPEEGRIYPHYWTPVITNFKGYRIIQPMRYRVRPHDSEKEVPSKYNLFNARFDSLTTRQTWKPLLGHKQCLVPMSAFYEWVVHEGEKKQIQFFPESGELRAAAGLYDEWVSPDGKKFIKSFAIITNDPPPEVEEMGHDRCPIFLNTDQYDSWLQSSSAEESLSLLKNTGQLHYEHKFL